MSARSLALGVLLFFVDPSMARAQSRSELARACAVRGDDACVIATLTPPESPREYEVLILAHERLGHPQEALALLCDYVQRFPRARRTAEFRARTAARCPP